MPHVPAWPRAPPPPRPRAPPERTWAARVVSGRVAVRSPNLHEALRCFCLGAFSVLDGELRDGAQLPFAFEEHAASGRPALYEYRPLVREFIEARAERLVRREDARLAVDELEREPAAAIFARAHADGTEGGRALVSSVLVPLLVRTAEGCGGFDWDDRAWERAYAELEGSLYGEGHAYTAVAPLVGLSLATPVELGGGIVVRQAATGELAAHWPETQGLLPPGFGREPDRLCVMELARSLPAGDAEPPDAPGELADAVTAVRLATDGAVATGAVIFERLDWRPYAIRPTVPIAGTIPLGDPARLDVFRARLVRDLRQRLTIADDDPELGEALDRWELSLFQSEPFRSEQLRAALFGLLGGGEETSSAVFRVALLLGETGPARAQLLERVRALARGTTADEPATSAVRRALVETILHGDRPALLGALDDALLGVRPRPVGYYARLAAGGPRGASEAA